MNLVHNRAATDKYGLFSDQTVYVAILAKIKAQLHGEPETFAKFKELMIEFRQRARKDYWDDMQLAAESNKLKATLESTLPHHMPEIWLSILFRRGVTQQLRLNGSKKRHSILLDVSEETRCSILDFLNDLKAICAAKILGVPLAMLGNPQTRYNAFIRLMREYLEDIIEYRIFLRRGLDLCDGVTSTVSLQSRFLGQFCNDISLESLNTEASIAPLLLSVGTSGPI